MSRLSNNPFGRVFVPRGLLPHLTDIYRNVPVRGDAGDTNPTPVLIYKNVGCWVQPLTADEQLQHARLGLYFSHKIVFYQNPGIANGDILIWIDGKGATAVQRTLTVTGIRSPLGVNITWIVQATETQ